MKGNPVDLVGPRLQPGDPAPDFKCVGEGLALVTLADTAGKARLDWNALPGPRGGFESKLHLESVGLVSKLFRVLDDYTSLLNPSLCVLSSQSVTHEGVRHREASITFDPAARKASYLERDTARNTTLLAQEIEIPACVHDVVGGLYFLRT
jgi:hypothetical protein